MRSRTIKRQRKQSPEQRLVPSVLLGRRTGLVLAAVYFAVLLYVGFTYHTIGDYAVETDFYWAYAPHAKQILQGHIEIDPFKGPGYEIVLAAFGFVVGEFFKAGMLLSILSAAIVLWLTYRLLERVFNAEAAFLTCLVLATNFVFLVNSYTPATDMFFNLLAVLVLYFLLRSSDMNLWDYAIAGAITGFAYVTRYNAVSFYLAAIVGLLVLNYTHADWRQRLYATGAFVGASLVFVVPWGLYCLAEKGSFFYNQNHLNIAYEMYGRGKVGWDEYWNTVAVKFHSYLDVIASSPSTFFGQIAANTVGHLWKNVSLLVGLPVGIFSIGGVASAVSMKRDRRQAMYFLFSVSFYLVLLPVFYGERFSLFLAPAIILLSVLFFQWKNIPTFGFGSFGAKHLLLYGVIFASAIASFNRVGEVIDSGPKEVLVVRDVFLQRGYTSAPGDAIIARKPHIAYYLDMKFVPFPYVATIDEVLREGKKAGGRYLFFSGIEAGMRPQFQFLLDPGNAPPGFRPIVQIVDPPAVLYELTEE
jgi:4-amino-4-deoxy-L-arabinose transferase-like glycosyltransferase